MGYCTRQDIEARLPAATLLHFTDLDQDGDEDAGVVDGAIGAAGAIVETYLAPRYPIPVTPVPRILADATASIAIWKLAAGRGYDDTSADKALRMSHDDAMRWLKDIGAGRAQLPGATVGGDTAATAPATGFVLNTRAPSVLDRLDRYG